MSKILTLSGSDPSATPAPNLTDVVKGWTWKHILAVLAGVGGIVGGGLLAWQGWSKDKTLAKWGGLALAAGGAITVGVAVYFAHVRAKAIADGLIQGMQQRLGDPPLQARYAQPGQVVALTDGRRGRVESVQPLSLGGAQYHLQFLDPAGRLRADDFDYIDSGKVAGIVG